VDRQHVGRAAGRDLAFGFREVGERDHRRGPEATLQLLRQRQADDDDPRLRASVGSRPDDSRSSSSIDRRAMVPMA
jgi:hypothetical protein